MVKKTQPKKSEPKPIFVAPSKKSTYVAPIPRAFHKSDYQMLTDMTASSFVKGDPHSNVSVENIIKKKFNTFNVNMKSFKEPVRFIIKGYLDTESKIFLNESGKKQKLSTKIATTGDFQSALNRLDHKRFYKIYEKLAGLGKCDYKIGNPPRSLNNTEKISLAEGMEYFKGFTYKSPVIADSSNILDFKIESTTPVLYNLLDDPEEKEGNIMEFLEQDSETTFRVGEIIDGKECLFYIEAAGFWCMPDNSYMGGTYRVTNVESAEPLKNAPLEDEVSLDEEEESQLVVVKVSPSKKRKQSVQIEELSDEEESEESEEEEAPPKKKRTRLQ